MANIGRNEPCHCGSGKKYKHCHLKSDDQKVFSNQSIIIGFIIALFIIISAFWLLTDKKPKGSTAPGPAPAGKVWSPEHGHWHDK